MRTKTLLFIGAGPEQVAGILKARSMGLRVFVIDANPNARAIKFAHRFFNVSTHDYEAAVELAVWLNGRFRLDGVATIGVDAPRTLAAISEKLGFFGPSWETALFCSDKLLQKQALSRAGLPVPEFRLIDSHQDTEEMLERCGALVLKPTDSRGSRGVVQLHSSRDIAALLDIVRSNSPQGKVMAERMIRGAQISTESLIIEGRAYTVGFSDRNYEYWDRFAPHIIENGGDMPSRFTHLYETINELIEHSAKVLGVRNGILKGDIAVEGDKPIIIEFACRPSGGFFCTHQIPYSWGNDFARLIIYMYLGNLPKLQPIDIRTFAGSSIRFVHPEPGLITKISGIKDAYRAGAKSVRMLKLIGDQIPLPTNSNAAAAAIITKAPSRELAQIQAIQATRAIKFEIKPLTVDVRHEDISDCCAPR